MLPIVQAPHTVLSTVAKRITKFDSSLEDLIKEMITTLETATDPEGVGLAAPQVGKSLRLFIIKEDEDAPIKVYANPSLEMIAKDKEELPTKKTKKDKEVKLEGCLSLKDIWGIVHRHEKVKITYQDIKGISHTETHSGFFATILQHEYDHIEGVLFPKRVLEQSGQLYKSVKDKKGETIFEELSI